jgi:predicted RNase H-like HicB family nuclease
MLTTYIQSALEHAHYEILEDQSYYGEIPGIQGVYANEATLEECRHELQQVLEDWMLFSLSRNLPIPPIAGVHLSVKEVSI